MKEAHIAGIGTALPYRVCTERFLQIDAEMRRHHGQTHQVIEHARSLANDSGVEARYSVHSGWLEPEARPKERQDIFTPTHFNPPSWQRMRAWQEHAPPLAIEAARKALAAWGGDPNQITHIITSSSSGSSEPGLAYAIIQALALPLDCQRVELNINSSFCGMTCLHVARDMIRAGSAEAVLIVAAELATNHYNVVEADESTLISNALLSDGSAAMILAPQGPWRFEKSGMSLVSNSHDMFRWGPDTDRSRESLRMFLHPTIGSRLAQFFREEHGRALLEHAIAMSYNEYPALALSPGVPSVLNAMNNMFAEYGWHQEALTPSISTLHSKGNLGSAALLFVLEDLLKHNLPQNHLAAFAFGPALTVEWALLCRVP